MFYIWTDHITHFILLEDPLKPESKFWLYNYFFACLDFRALAKYQVLYMFLLRKCINSTGEMKRKQESKQIFHLILPVFDTVVNFLRKFLLSVENA